MQSAVTGSKAAQRLNSFPVTAANDPKAIVQLKERFGREDFVVQIYVRDLLGLVTKNATTGRTRGNLKMAEADVCNITAEPTSEDILMKVEQDVVHLQTLHSILQGILAFMGRTDNLTIPDPFCTVHGMEFSLTLAVFLMLAYTNTMFQNLTKDQENETKTGGHIQDYEEKINKVSYELRHLS